MRAAGLKGHRMKFLRHQRCTRTLIAAFIIAALSSPIALASAWSQSRVIKLVTPYPSGGFNEAMFRMIADQIGRQGGPTFIVEARPGAGTMIATEQVSRAAQPGHPTEGTLGRTALCRSSVPQKDQSSMGCHPPTLPSDLRPCDDRPSRNVSGTAVSESRYILRRWPRSPARSSELAINLSVVRWQS